ncbi:MAG: ABC transporter ATP-binding protein [Desulfomonilia bacterium]|jgi:iron complex transport system ATP-binding protein|uniref:ABC transporter n=1 Tax=anaerobic digester metagenome TaxID=1263854 RepID=A0A485M1M0_9ZZZZ|nr:ABC transporter ATP-binding protein [Pseudomonadota bacterium]HRR22267.1 ABC transporter ATP-binding protein [Desulfomonilia bacterium]HRR70189.1 ABC transporter ATP-binding protein [Desulfomonilia bacterium]HRT45975.1 ABC transporter ATP-binding protein [Desulfomonilia bacterium]
MFIRVENISFSYGKKEVLDDVSLSFRRGEVVSLLGPNGSGKTTLLKVLLGILKPSRGRVLFEGAPIVAIGAKRFARRVAYVPQLHHGAFSYSVLDVVLMGRMPYKNFFSRFTRRDNEIAESMLEKLGIVHLKHKPYTEISGGERQLTLIARALAQGADTFIMDEPITGLDYGNQIRLLEQIMVLSAEGHTVIKSTHFPDHALWVSDRAVLMKDGTVAADGTASGEITAGNLGKLYNIPVRVMDAGNGFSVCIPSSKKWECTCRDRKNGPAHHKHDCFRKEGGETRAGKTACSGEGKKE